MKRLLYLLLLISGYVYPQASPLTDNDGNPISYNDAPIVTGAYPATLGSKILWIKTDEGVNIDYYLDASNNVIMPINRGNSGYSFSVQNTVSQRATIVMNEANGQAVYRFTAANSQYYSYTNITNSLFTCIFVYKKTGTGVSGSILGGIGVKSIVNYTNGYTYCHVGSSYQSCLTGHATSWRIECITYTPGIVFYKNNLSSCSYTTTYGSSFLCYFGLSGYPATSYMDGDIAELIYFNAVLNAATISNLFKYFSYKYAISLYTDNVPYFNPLDKKEFRFKDTYASSITNCYGILSLGYNKLQAIRNEEDYI